MSEDRLFKCDASKQPIYSFYAVVEDSKTTEHYVYFSGKDIPKLKLQKGDFVYLSKGEIDNPIKFFEVYLFVSGDMIQCVIPPSQANNK